MADLVIGGRSSVRVSGLARLESPTQAAIWLMLATMTRLGER